MKLRDIIEGKDYDFIEVRAICTDGKGARDDVYLGWCASQGGVLVCAEGEDYTPEDEFAGFTEWNEGAGIAFNGVNINATVWKVIAGE